MGREENLRAVAAGAGHFRDSRTAVPKQLKPGGPALVQVFCGDIVALATSEPELRGSHVIDQKKSAVFVLNRDACGKLADNISQQDKLAVEREFGLLLGGGRNLIGERVFHCRPKVTNSFVLLVKYAITGWSAAG
jgi:hypothetical protein